MMISLLASACNMVQRNCFEFAPCAASINYLLTEVAQQLLCERVLRFVLELVPVDVADMLRTAEALLERMYPSHRWLRALVCVH